MLAKKLASMASACALLVLALPLAAQNADTLVERYAGLAGSQKNAQALVTGLRESRTIKLDSGQSSVTIEPPTQKMGYGNIDNALALAEASLKGTDNPTPQQLKRALMGVLDMRADGMGWGQIANSLGFRLGDVKRAERAPERVARAAKPERPERVQRPERPERPAKPERPERPGR
jgi:hypothetical protein